VPPGFLVFATEGALNAVRFDLSRLAIAGTPVPVLDRVITKTTRGTNYAVSRNGSLVYASGDPIRPTDTIAWVGRDAGEETIRVPPHMYVMLRVSPDGQYVVLDARDEEMDLWLLEFKSNTMERLTSEPVPDNYPVWSRNQDRRLYLNSGPVGERGLFRMDLPRAPERLTKSFGPPPIPTTISPDGKWLVISGGPPAVGLTMVSTESGHEALPRAERTPTSRPTDSGSLISRPPPAEARSTCIRFRIPRRSAVRWARGRARSGRRLAGSYSISMPTGA
jgi:hypothetical protein